MPDEAGPSITTILGSAGACPEITALGKTWKIGHPTQRAKAVLEQLVVASAVAEVRQLKDVLPPDAYAETFRELTDAIASRHYKTWGAGWQRIVWGPRSGYLFLLSLLREHHPTATEDDVAALAGAAPEEVTAALIEVTPNFIRLLLLDRKDITPEQQAAIQGVMTDLIEKMTQKLAPSPEPTPEMPAESLPSGAKHSHKNRGASTPTKSPGLPTGKS